MFRFLFTISFLLSVAANATAQRLVLIGVPSEMDAATSKNVLNATLSIIINVDDGARIQVFDALNLQQVADMTIPANSGKSNSKVRVVRLKNEIAELKKYFMRSASVRSGKPAQIKVPQFFDLAGSGVKSSSGDTTVVLFGSPYYLDERDSAFVFGKGVFPSDGHVITSSKRSVFGTADKRDLLKGATVHFCYIGDDFETTLEHAAIRRFWKVYCDNVGAVLSTFGPSGEVTVERCLRNVKDGVSGDRIDSNDTVLEMRSVRAVLDRGPASPITERGAVAPQDVNNTRSSQQLETPIVHEDVEAALQSVPKPKPRSLVLAAAWLAENDPGAADVDLYVRPHREASELDFKHTVTAEGRYLRDIREANRSLNSNSWGASWEAVEVEEARLVDVTCWLNLYRGCGGKVAGVVRIAHGELTADVPFDFPAIAGDSAAGRLSRTDDPCWIEIQLDQLQWTRDR